MREIKFRAWDKEKNVMYYNHSVSIGIDGIICFLEESGEWIINLERIEIMQYTGLKDKNSKEIYEGDICINEYGLKDYYYIVEWIYSGFQLVTYKKAGSKVRGISHRINQGYFEDAEGIEVIGNIYENDGLLEV